MAKKGSKHGNARRTDGHATSKDLKRVEKAASLYSRLAGKELFIAYGAPSGPQICRVSFNKHNFAHLAGVKPMHAKGVNAAAVYKRALDGSLSESDCTLTHADPRLLKSKMRTIEALSRITSDATLIGTFTQNYASIAIGADGWCVGFAPSHGELVPVTAMSEPLATMVAETEPYPIVATGIRPLGSDKAVELLITRPGMDLAQAMRIHRAFGDEGIAVRDAYGTIAGLLDLEERIAEAAAETPVPLLTGAHAVTGIPGGVPRLRLPDGRTLSAAEAHELFAILGAAEYGRDAHPPVPEPDMFTMHPGQPGDRYARFLDYQNGTVSATIGEGPLGWEWTTSDHSARHSGAADSLGEAYAAAATSLGADPAAAMELGVRAESMLDAPASLPAQHRFPPSARGAPVERRAARSR